MFIDYINCLKIIDVFVGEAILISVRQFPLSMNYFYFLKQMNNDLKEVAYDPR